MVQLWKFFQNLNISETLVRINSTTSSPLESRFNETIFCHFSSVFHFKHAVSGATSTPDVEEGYIWLPTDATLKWAVTSDENKKLKYNVTAFRGHLQEFVDSTALKNDSNKNAFSSFLSLFSKSKVARSKLSCADPTNIVNSCGEKFIKGK